MNYHQVVDHVLALRMELVAKLDKIATDYKNEYAFKVGEIINVYFTYGGQRQKIDLRIVSVHCKFKKNHNPIIYYYVTVVDVAWKVFFPKDKIYTHEDIYHDVAPKWLLKLIRRRLNTYEITHPEVKSPYL